MSVYRKISRVSVWLSVVIAVCWTILFVLIVADLFDQDVEGNTRYFAIVRWMVGMWGIAITVLFVWVSCHWMDKMLKRQFVAPAEEPTAQE